MRSIEQISHKLDRYAATLKPERAVRLSHALAQIITDDGRVRLDKADGFLAPQHIPVEAFERGALYTINFGTIANGAVGVLNVTFDGAEENDAVLLGPPSTLEAGLLAFGVVTAPNTITVRLHNGSGASFSPAAATWRIGVLR